LKVEAMVLGCFGLISRTWDWFEGHLQVETMSLSMKYWGKRVSPRDFLIIQFWDEEMTT
jgi:hypothetical protein